MSNIHEQIKILIQVQDVEEKIDQVDRRIRSLSQEAGRMEQQVAEQESRVADDIRSLEDLKKAYRELEAESKLNGDLVVKSNEKLRSVKTNKEYQSILKEIEEIRKKNSAIEDQMIAQLEAIESAESTVAERSAELEAYKRTCDEKKVALEEEARSERRAIEALGAEKLQVSDQADPKMVAVLDDVRKKVRGLAVVPVQQATCMGCHMNIPPQLYNELQRFDELRFCPHCQRIIYWQEIQP
jgi:predicted  nucleic acid-binding Zn-ribbon protein